MQVAVVVPPLACFSCTCPILNRHAIQDYYYMHYSFRYQGEILEIWGQDSLAFSYHNSGNSCKTFFMRGSQSRSDLFKYMWKINIKEKAVEATHRGNVIVIQHIDTTTLSRKKVHEGTEGQIVTIISHFFIYHFLF